MQDEKQKPFPQFIDRNPKRHFHWAMFIVLALSFTAALLVSIEKFKTEEEIDSLASAIFPRQDVGKGTGDVELKSWKTYRNEEYGFELKYPSSWSLLGAEDEKLASGLIIVPGFCDLKQGCVMKDELIIFPKGQGSNKTVFEDNYLGCSITKTTLGGTSALECIDEAGDAVYDGAFRILPDGMPAWSVNNVIAYRVLKNQEHSTEYIGIIRQILSSFRFIEKFDINNWKIYKNEEYGFEFKYPKDFMIGKFKFENTVTSKWGWNYAVVLIESQLVAKAATSKSFSLDHIPFGEFSTITIRLLTVSTDFYKTNNNSETKDVKIGEYMVIKRPVSPWPYGDTMYYYAFPAPDNLLIEFTGHKKRFSMFSIPDTLDIESHYDQVIENIIPTFKFTK